MLQLIDHFIILHSFVISRYPPLFQTSPVSFSDSLSSSFSELVPVSESPALSTFRVFSIFLRASESAKGLEAYGATLFNHFIFLPGVLKSRQVCFMSQTEPKLTLSDAQALSGV